MARAVALLARREHARVELARKLARYREESDDPDEIDRVLDALEAQGLLSDARYAASLVRSRAARYGDRRVARDLHERGVDPTAASDALDVLRGTEERRALAVWARRFDALPRDAAERGRQGRYLEARGFAASVIHRVLAGKVASQD